MSRSRRGSRGGMHFPASGEDSFVAVVITKLTGAMIFLFVVSLAIIALIPKVDGPSVPSIGDEAEPIVIATRGALPDAIAGRPYRLALAGRGGNGPLRWSVEGDLPAGLSFDPDAGEIRGVPEGSAASSAPLRLRAASGAVVAEESASLAVVRAEGPAPRFDLRAISWQTWAGEGLGLLLLALAALLGAGLIRDLARRAPGARIRVALYRATFAVGSLSIAVGLGAWLWAFYHP